MVLTKKERTYIFSGIVLIIMLFLLFSKRTNPEFSCDGWANNFKNDFTCRIVLEKKSQYAGITTLSGQDLDTKQTVDCIDGSKWVGDNFSKFMTGDTIIKNKGEYTIHIIRKEKKVDIVLICNEKPYNDLKK